MSYDFLQFAQAHGLKIERLVVGKITRVKTNDHPHKRNGAYLYEDGRGWVMDWANGEDPIWWQTDTKRDLTEKQKQEWNARRKEVNSERLTAYAEAAKRAAEMIRSAVRGPHPYLKEKGFPDVLTLTVGDTMLVPMRDVHTDKLRGVQTIDLVDNKWQKKMLSGMRAKGAVLRIGTPKAPESILVEGYATALSVEVAAKFLNLRTAIVTCFSASNLVFVAPQMGGRKFVFADNDESETGERAAKETGLPYCIADEVGMDANDMHRAFGFMAVAQKLMSLRRM